MWNYVFQWFKVWCLVFKENSVEQQQIVFYKISLEKGKIQRHDQEHEDGRYAFENY